MTENDATLLDLPDHIIVENILSELIPSSLCGDGTKPGDLRDILSFASTCTRIHALASHPTLWRRVNGAVFCDGFKRAVGHNIAPPPLPLGSVHCEVFRTDRKLIDQSTTSLMETFSDLVDVRIGDNRVVRSRVVRVISSLPRLVRLELFSGRLVYGLSGSRSLRSRSLESLSVCGGSTEFLEFFSSNSFPALVDVVLRIESEDPSEVLVAVSKSCPVLSSVVLNGRLDGPDVVSFVGDCQSLRRVRVETSGYLVVGEEYSSVRCPHLRELSVMASRISGRFLALFPDLVRLELVMFTKLSGDALSAIGGMMNLEHLVLDGSGFDDDTCRRLLPLVNHPMAGGRRSLQSLELQLFNCDIGDFLSSPWCSHLTKLTFENCTLSDATLEMFTVAHGTTLSSTLRSLTAQSTLFSGRSFGRLVSVLSSMKRLKIACRKMAFDVNMFIGEMERSHSKLSQFSLIAGDDGKRVILSPLLPVISDATEIVLNCNIDQAATNSVADSCRRLLRFEVSSAAAFIKRPTTLVESCAYVSK